MTRTAAPAGTAEYWAGWLHSWDRQQEGYLPDREERFRVMLDVVESLAGSGPRVLDLACGPGSLSDRLLRRLPAAVSVGVDQDPALLTIARGFFADEPRVSFATADLGDPGWAGRLPAGSFDAVLTATALHWLPTAVLLRLYHDLAGLLRPGGVFLNADHMPDPAIPLLDAADRRRQEAWQRREREAGVPDWAGWWQQAAADPLLSDAVAARNALYGSHFDGDIHAADWHTGRLREAGFAEAGVVWRSVQDAVVAAVR